MIYREDEEGTKTVESADTRPLEDIQAEKRAALAADPSLDINPCSATPLNELLP